MSLCLDDIIQQLYVDEHISYVISTIEQGVSRLLAIPELENNNSSNMPSEPLMDTLITSGVFWSLTALDVLDALSTMRSLNKNETSGIARRGWMCLPIQIVKNLEKFVLKCQCVERDNICMGGFGPHPHHTPSVISTLSALQILCILKKGKEIFSGTVVRGDECSDRGQSHIGDLKCWDCETEEDSILSEGMKSAVLRFLRSSLVASQGYFVDCPPLTSFGMGAPIGCSSGDRRVHERKGMSSEGGDGWFVGCDVRVTFCALSTLRLLHVGFSEFFESVDNRDDESGTYSDTTERQVERPIPGHYYEQKVIQFLLACQNEDGGFGCSPGNESHAGHTFCCISALKLLGALEDPIFPTAKRFSLKMWLRRRQKFQLPSKKSFSGFPRTVQYGGVNGRVGKDADSCYTWWTTAVCCTMGWKPSEVFPDTKEIIRFVLRCQCADGGFCRSRDNAHHTSQKSNVSGGVLLGVDNMADVSGGDEKTNGREASLDVLKLVFGTPGKATPETRHKDIFHTCFALLGLLVLCEQQNSTTPETVKIHLTFAMLEQTLRKCIND